MVTNKYKSIPRGILFNLDSGFLKYKLPISLVGFTWVMVIMTKYLTDEFGFWVIEIVDYDVLGVTGDRDYLYSDEGGDHLLSGRASPSVDEREDFGPRGLDEATEEVADETQPEATEETEAAEETEETEEGREKYTIYGKYRKGKRTICSTIEIDPRSTIRELYTAFAGVIGTNTIKISSVSEKFIARTDTTIIERADINNGDILSIHI